MFTLVTVCHICSVSVLNTAMGISLLKSEKAPCFHIYTLCKALSEKFKCIGNQYCNREVLKTKHVLRISLMRAKLKRDTQVIVFHVNAVEVMLGKQVDH